MMQHIAEVYDKHLIFLHKAQKDVLYAAILTTEDKKNLSFRHFL